MIRLLVVDDHPVVTAGLAAELANEPDMEVVASAGTVEDAIRLIEQTVPDVVIADVLFGTRPRGLELVDRYGRDLRPAILLFSNYAPPATVWAAREHGAAGYLTKEASTAELVAAIRTIVGGYDFFPRELLDAAGCALETPTAREIEIIEAIAGGAANKEVAAALQISPRTVETHLTRCFARYAIASRAELVAIAIREHWLPEALRSSRPTSPRQLQR